MNLNLIVSFAFSTMTFPSPLYRCLVRNAQFNDSMLCYSYRINADKAIKRASVGKYKDALVNPFCECMLWSRLLSFSCSDRCCFHELPLGTIDHTVHASCGHSAASEE